MMRLRQFIPGLFCHCWAEKPNRNGIRKSHRCTARKMCACSTRILARGQLRPPLHPPDQDLRPVDPTRRASPSGLPTGRGFTLRPPDRCFASGFDQESLRALHGPPDRGRLRSSPGPPSTSRPPSGPAPGLSRPCPTNRLACRPGAPAPCRAESQRRRKPWADWMRPSHAIAWGYSLPVYCDSGRTGSPGSARRFREPGWVSGGSFLKIHAGGKQP